MGLADADSMEHGVASGNYVIVPVSCPAPKGPGSPALSTGGQVRFKPGSRLAAIYGAAEAREEYFCNYEVNPDFTPRLEQAGLTVTAWGAQGEPRAVELNGHPFFLATLFQPQLTSGATQMPHPVIVAFLKAAREFQRARVRKPAS